MENITLDKAGFDLLTRCVVEINKAMKANQLNALYTEVLDSEEAAKYLKVSEKYLQRLRDAGEIAFSQRGTLVRFLKKDLDKWLQKYRVE